MKLFILSFLLSFTTAAHANLQICPRMPSASAVTHQWISAISNGGAVTQSQPACSDLSNAAASCSTDTTVATNITTGTLGATVQGNITTVGTITSGVWNGTAVDVTHGGTGRASLTNHGVLIGAGTSAVTQLAAAGAGTLLNGAASADPSFTSTPTLGLASGTTGSLGFVGTTSGTVTLSVADAAGTWTMKLPTTAGSNGNALTTNGSGVTSWTAVLTNPATAAFDTFYQNAGNTAVTNLANGTTGQYYKATASGAPSWVSFTTPAQATQASTGTQTGQMFTVSGVTTAPTNGATYTNNAHTFTVLVTSSDKTEIFTSCGTCTTSGTTLSKSAGTGDSSITFSATTSLATYTPGSTAKALEMVVVGGGGGGGQAALTGASTSSAAGGGAGGGCAIKLVTGFTAPIYYMIGAAGSAAGAGGQSAVTDSAGSFLLLANGGGAGASGSASAGPVFNSGVNPGSGGGASGGDLNIQGSGSAPGITLGAGQAGAGGGGGSCLTPSQVQVQNNGTSNGTAGIGYGQGGSGGSALQSQSARAGSAGSAGVFRSIELYNGN